MHTQDGTGGSLGVGKSLFVFLLEKFAFQTMGFI